MRTNGTVTAQLGDLIVAAFDKAAQYSIDPREVARLATREVLRVLARTTAHDSDTSDTSDATQISNTLTPRRS